MSHITVLHITHFLCENTIVLEILRSVIQMNFQMNALNTDFDVTAIVNISYYRLSDNYVFPGESHDFWEFWYVDRGSIIVNNGINSYFMNDGELVFHPPGEFHAFQAIGKTEIITVSFCCDSEAMFRFENKVLFLHHREKSHLKMLIDEAQSVYQYFENDPPYINMKKKPLSLRQNVLILKNRSSDSKTSLKK